MINQQMVVKLGTTSPLTATGGIPMVELATINKALPGDSPEQLFFLKIFLLKKKQEHVFKHSMHLQVFLVLTISGDD